MFKKVKHNYILIFGLLILISLIVSFTSCKENPKIGKAKVPLYEINDNKLYPVLDTAILINEKDGYSKLIEIEYNDSTKVLNFIIFENKTFFNQDNIKNLKGVIEYKGYLFHFYNDFDNKNSWIKETKESKDIVYHFQIVNFKGDLTYTSFQFEDNEFTLLTEKE